MPWNIQEQDFSFWTNFTKDSLNLQILLCLLNFFEMTHVKSNCPCKERIQISAFVIFSS